MIRMVSLKCPECGANVSIEEERKHCFCQYCGTKIIMDDDSTTHIYRRVDEARIKEAEVEKLIRLKELELEEQKRATEQKNRLFKIKVSLALVIVGFVLLLIAFVGGIVVGEENPSFFAFVMSGMLGIWAFISIAFVWNKENGESESN